MDSTEFDNPPHEGSYLDDMSFVVVKNLGTEFEYAVNLVEQTKSGDYIGVQLATYNQVTGHDSSSYVVHFSFSDLPTINNSTAMKTYINSNLGSNYLDFEGKVSEVYNIPE